MQKPFGHPDTAKAIRSADLERKLHDIRAAAVLTTPTALPPQIAFAIASITAELGQLA